MKCVDKRKGEVARRSVLTEFLLLQKLAHFIVDAKDICVACE